MMKKGMFVSVVVILLSLWAFSAFGAQKLTLMLDWFPNVDHLPIYVAREQGYFSEKGLEIKILSPSDTSDALKLAASGSVDIAISYQPQTIIAASEGINVTVIGRLIEHPLTTLLFLKVHGITPYKEKAREKYMSPAQSEHFRDILLAWKKDLLDEVSKTIHLMQDENINHPDPNDRASQETDMSLELRNRDRERKLLKKIDSTVAKVDNGDYGWCDRCGIDIGIRRLEARPTADLCVDCKTLNEIKERQMI